jgi:hypothetical protein
MNALNAARAGMSCRATRFIASKPVQQTAESLQAKGGSCMLRDLVVSFSIVTALVAPLVWYAGQPECTLWHSSAHQASAADASSFSPIFVSRFNYSADGARFLSSYRGEVAGSQSLILHDTS